MQFGVLLHYSTNFSDMSPTLTSQGLVLATAMAVSAGTAVLFDLLREKYFPPAPQILRNHKKTSLKSCLSSGSKKRGREVMKKKKVKFAEDVKDTKGNGELYRKEGRKWDETSCGNEIAGSDKMPANRAALYTGILKDRVHRIECSY